MTKKRAIIAVVVLIAIIALACLSYHRWLAPTRILIVNALKAQQADFDSF